MTICIIKKFSTSDYCCCNEYLPTANLLEELNKYIKNIDEKIDENMQQIDKKMEKIHEKIEKHDRKMEATLNSLRNELKNLTNNKIIKKSLPKLPKHCTMYNELTSPTRKSTARGSGFCDHGL